MPLVLIAIPLLVACSQQARTGFTAATSAAAPSDGAATAAPSTVSASAAPGSHATSLPPNVAIVARVGTGTAAEKLLTVDAATGRILATLPLGVPDATWSTLYVTSESNGSTAVRALDPRSARELRRIEIAGSWALPMLVPSALPVGLAQGGNRLVLVDRSPGQGLSRFAVLDTALNGAPRILTLTGQFAFDAIGPDAHYVFLIEHLGGSQGGHYQVRAYDLFAGSLADGAVVDKRNVGEVMEGRPLARASTDDGRWAYTIYVRADGRAFVHQLDTLHAGALCVDLPDETRAATTADANAWRIAVGGSSGGFVANGRVGFVGSLGEGSVGATLKLTGASPVELTTGSHGNVLLLGPDGIMSLDATLNLLGRGSAAATSFAASPSGDLVYALTAAGQLERVSVTSAAVKTGVAIDLDHGIDWNGATIVGVSGG